MIEYYPPAYNSTYVKATSVVNTAHQAHMATYPDTYYDGYRNLNALQASWDYNGWQAASTTTNQRFHIDLGSAYVINILKFINLYSGTTNYSTSGWKNFIVQGSNSSTAFSTLTYGTDTNWTQLTGQSRSKLDQSVYGTPAFSYIGFYNTTAYRYYAIKLADTYGGAYAHAGVRRFRLCYSPFRSGFNQFFDI
jgi:hypothetical protein